MIGRFSNLGVYRELFRSRDLLRIVAAGGLAVASHVVSLRSGSASAPWALALAGVSVALNGLPIVWSALRGLLERRLNVDELVSLAIVASLLRGEVLTAAVVSFVMVFGSLIEQATANSARKAVRSLVSLAPDRATVLRSGRPLEVSAADIVVGDHLLIRPGERVPVDGSVVEGSTWIDESSMTGEPMPVEKAEGDIVFAGTLNHAGLVEIAATRVGPDTTLGRVVALVSDAEAHRPQSVRLIDRYARWFTPTILAAAALAWALTGQADRAIAVLIVGCPCALILAAPTAVVATIGRAARAGVLVKGGVHLETVGRVDTVLFDKTGTLTGGRPVVDEVLPAGGVEPADVLKRAAAVEQHSSHPLGRAVVAAASEAGLALVPVHEMSTTVGFGVSGVVNGRVVEVGNPAFVGGGTPPGPLDAHVARMRQRGATTMVVLEDRRLMGILAVTDQARPGALDAVQRLRRLGIRRVGLLSGDHEQAARRIADAVGADDCWAGIAPDEKPEIVRRLQSDGATVLFVGDGINDAPALATADVGVAMGGAGTDVALETADIALMRDDLTKIAFLVTLGRRMLRVITWNVAFGVTFNAMAVVASGSGYLTPIAGAIVHNLGSVLVVLTSATMAFVREPPCPGRALEPDVVRRE